LYGYVFQATGLDTWNTSSLKNFSKAFSGTIKFNALFTKYWDMRNVETMERVFGEEITFENFEVQYYPTNSITIDMSLWYTPKLQRLDSFMIFLDNQIFDAGYDLPKSQITGIENLNTANVTRLDFAFKDARYIDCKFIENWNLKKVITIRSMAAVYDILVNTITTRPYSLFNPDFSKIKFRDLEDASRAFINADSFEGKGFFNAISGSNVNNLDNTFLNSGITPSNGDSSNTDLPNFSLELALSLDIMLGAGVSGTAENMMFLTRVSGALSLANKKLLLRNAYRNSSRARIQPKT
jgi:hypothetical protein